jgi:AcrR family transcriptional regulator
MPQSTELFDKGSKTNLKDDLNRSFRSESRGGRRRSEESEEAILAATIQLLSQKPLRDISIEEIARKANVGKTTIYKWWPSKAYVALDAFLRKINRMVPMPDTGSVRRDLLEQCRSLIAFFKSPAGRILGQFVAESESDKEFGSLFRELFLKPRREAAGVVFDRGVQRGEIDQNVDRELVLDIIYGSTIFRLFVGHSPLDDKLAEQMVSVLFEGLDKKQPKRAEIESTIARKRSTSRASK